MFPSPNLIATRSRNHFSKTKREREREREGGGGGEKDIPFLVFLKAQFELKRRVVSVNKNKKITSPPTAPVFTTSSPMLPPPTTETWQLGGKPYSIHQTGRTLDLLPAPDSRSVTMEAIIIEEMAGFLSTRILNPPRTTLFLSWQMTRSFSPFSKYFSLVSSKKKSIREHRNT